VGLGNPGIRYDETRHNYGFMVVDEIAKQLSFPSFTPKFKSTISHTTQYGSKILLLKPQTYMNIAGTAVQECSSFYKIPNANIFVIHDDLDLPLGKIKIKKGGGSGGHNGLKSIDQSIGKDYTRIRLGISKPLHQSAITNFVLQSFSPEEMDVTRVASMFIAEHLELLITSRYDVFLNQYAMQYTKIVINTKKEEKDGI